MARPRDSIAGLYATLAKNKVTVTYGAIGATALSGLLPWCTRFW